MNAGMISYQAWCELESRFPEAAKFLYEDSLRNEIMYLEKQAKLTTSSSHEKELVEKIFALREELNKAVEDYPEIGQHGLNRKNNSNIPR